MQKLLLLAGAIVYGGCTSQSAGRIGDAKDLIRAGSCSISGGGYAQIGNNAPSATMSLRNDGGWCWQTVATHSFGASAGTGVPFTLTEAPTNGTVQITVFDDTTRIAYKANTGYKGTDKFETLNNTYNIARVTNVVVR